MYSVTEEYQRQNAPMMSVMLNSRTVVEKKEFISTGILTYVEGDVIEIEIGDYRAFELSDKVKVTVYTPIGIFTFTTSVLAKEQGSVMVINPPENRQKFAEKRVHTRLEIDKTGKLEGIRAFERAQLQILPEPLTMMMKNVSMAGIGFVLKGELKLEGGMHIMFTADIGIRLSCSAMITRNVNMLQNIENYYGAELVDVPDPQMKALRAFLLTKQIEMYSQSKKLGQKRVFR